MCKYLLDGDLCKNICYFHIFSGISNTILSDALISPVSELRTEQVMTSLIRPQIEYLLQTCLVLIL